MHNNSLSPFPPIAYSQAPALHSPCVFPRSYAFFCSHSAVRCPPHRRSPVTAVLLSSSVPPQLRDSLSVRGAPPLAVRILRTLARTNLTFHGRTRAQKAFRRFTRRVQGRTLNESSLAYLRHSQLVQRHPTGLIAGNRLCGRTGFRRGRTPRDWWGRSAPDRRACPKPT